MFIPAPASHPQTKISVIKQDQFVAATTSRLSIAQWCSFISCISGFHPKTNCHGCEAWHATCDDVITGSFSREQQIVISP